MSIRTPSELKWLLVERATLAGDINRLRERQALICQEIAEREAKILALDTTMLLVTQGTPVRNGQAVRAFSQEYPKRGALKDFIVTSLKCVAPEPLDTLSVTRFTAEYFGFNFATAAELKKFSRNSVVSQLRRLRDDGEVEMLFRGVGDNSPGLWRWKQLPTLAEIAAQAAHN